MKSHSERPTSTGLPSRLGSSARASASPLSEPPDFGGGGGGLSIPPASVVLAGGLQLPGSQTNQSCGCTSVKPAIGVASNFFFSAVSRKLRNRSPVAFEQDAQRSVVRALQRVER